MTTLKRFEFNIGYVALDAPSVFVDEVSDGTYVRFDDVEKLITKIANDRKWARKAAKRWKKQFKEQLRIKRFQNKMISDLIKKVST